MNSDPESPSAMAEAFNWLGRISTAVLMMIAPGFAGSWLDERFGTNFLAIAGFGLGLVLGVTTLVGIAGAASKRRRDSDGSGQGRGNGNG